MFKKVNSISGDISSAQMYYEEKILSIQEDLQELGESARLLPSHGAAVPIAGVCGDGAWAVVWLPWLAVWGQSMEWAMGWLPQLAVRGGNMGWVLGWFPWSVVWGWGVGWAMGFHGWWCGAGLLCPPFR